MIAAKPDEVGKRSPSDIDNVRQPIQMQLSKKQKTFSQFFSIFSKSRIKFEHFEKKDDLHGLCISETRDCERRG